MKLLSSFLLLFISFFVQGQDKLLSMQDAMLNARTTLAPETLKQLQFVNGTNDFVFVKKVDDQEVWVRGNMKNTEGTTFLTLEAINSRVRQANLDTLKKLPALTFDKEGFTLRINGKGYYFKNDNTYKVKGETVASGKEAVDEGAAGYVAYVDSFDLYVVKDGKSHRITTDGSEGIIYGKAVHQQEFGISKGTFWSNDGLLLAFYRMDQQMIPDYPIIDWSVRPAKVHNLKYPMAGDPSHHVTLGIYNTQTQKVSYIKTGEPVEQYLTNIAWAADGKSVFIAIVNREQNHMKLNQYDVSTGAWVKTLFEEKQGKYVEPQVPMLFLKNIPNQFIWQSRRDGWNHLYLYDISGKLIRQLTGGAWEVVDVKGFNEKGDMLYYVSTKESPISRNLYGLNIKSAKSIALTSGIANHITQVSSSGDYVIDNFSTIDNPRTIQLIDTRRGKGKVLLQAKDPLAGYSKGELSLFTLKSADGYELYSRLFKPAHFDANKKYPVIVYWYGGPHAQLILNSYNGGAGDYWFQYLAERGYVVFTVDTRGSANRGLAFEQTIFRHAGKMQMADLMVGVDYLKSQPWVDASRMGLFGWSYGGFMTTDFMITHPGVFKAAVAGGPVIDWKFYEIMYTERYMDTPKENPEGYEETDLTKRVENLNGKLMLIHGMQDPVVVMQHSVRFVKAAVDKGIQVDYMIYPGHEHNVLGKDRAHLYQKVTDYLFQNLQ
ncbi:MAG: S9 family peptidase [Ferruginibacter sp.]|nr:S9 family peptidase [Ferruginibacter sp.]